MVKVDLVTGFLGSGKTTFIKKYTKYLLAQGERIGILENDFGAVNVDMLMLNELRGDNLELEMVAGGCDADCHRRRFKTKLISMAMSGYDRVIIEPSGIFDMDEFFDALRESPLDNWYEINNVFCIVDATLDTDLSEEAEYILATQLADAGKIILSRVQETSPEQLEKTREYLGDVLNGLSAMGPTGKNSGEPVRELRDSDFLCIDWDELDGFDEYEDCVGYRDDELCKLTRAGVVIKDYVKKYNLDNISFGSECFLEPGKNIDEMCNIARILLETGDSMAEKPFGNIWRVKGFVESEDGWLEVNATSHGINIKPIPQGQDVIIVIGENLNKEKIREMFK